MINWTVRLKNKAFWVAFIPAIMMLFKQVCAMAGFDLDVDVVTNQLIEIVGTIFSILTIVGVVTDPTTKGLSDSAYAMRYRKPM